MLPYVDRSSGNANLNRRKYCHQLTDVSYDGLADIKASKLIYHFDLFLNITRLPYSFVLDLVMNQIKLI